MARVKRSRRRGGGLRRQAHQQAAAEYQPQVRGVRRDTRGQVGSLNSMDAALHDSLRSARRELRHSGLQSDDLAMALRELAYRGADISAGTQLNIQQARQAGQAEVQDLLSSQGQAEQGILSELLSDRQERRQDLVDERRGRRNKLVDTIRLEQALKRLGLGSYADDGGGEIDTSEAENARFHAKQLLDAARSDPDGPGDNPHEWPDEAWQGLTGAVQSKKGIDDVAAAQRAVEQLRTHFQVPTPYAPTDEGIAAALRALARGRKLR